MQEDFVEGKLLQLIEAIEAVLAYEEVEDVLGADLMTEFSAARKLVQDWLLHKSPMTLDQRLGALRVFTETLERHRLSTERRGRSLH